MKLRQPPIDFHKLFRTLLWVVPLGAIGNIVFLLVRTDQGALNSLHSFSLRTLGLAAVLGLVPWLTGTIRNLVWTRFLRKKLDFRESLGLVLGSELGAAVTPTAFGGGYVKLGLLIEKGFSPGAAASLMVITSVEDFFFFAITVPIGFAVSKPFLRTLPAGWRDFPHIAGDVLSVTAIALGIVLLGFLVGRRFGLRKKLLDIPWIRSIGNAVKTFLSDFLFIYREILRRGKLRFLLSLCLTSVQWICRYSVVSVLLHCFHIPVHPIPFFLGQWMVFTLGMFIPTPGGAGGVESAFFLMYRSFIPGGMIGLVTAAWRFLTYYMQLTIGSMVFSLLNIGSKPKPSAMPFCPESGTVP